MTLESLTDQTCGHLLLSSTVLGTAVADGTGNWSITSSTLSLGVHTLTAKQIDQAGNVSAASVSLALTVEAIPTPASPPATTPPIDGVAVTQHQVSLPGGGSGTQIIVPMVSIDRTDSSGSTGVADNSASSDYRVENHEG